jgi:nucleoside 2-deoxyribosyltransferase
MKKFIYLAGPISGLTYTQARFGWRKTIMEEVTEDVTVLSPMRHEGHLAELPTVIDEKTLGSHFFSHPKVIVTKDLLDIDVSSLVVANFLGAPAISKGTLHEVGYAFAKKKPIITLMEDKGNPNDGPFLREMSAIVLASLDDAVLVINSLLSEGI